MLAAVVVIVWAALEYVTVVQFDAVAGMVMAASVVITSAFVNDGLEVDGDDSRYDVIVESNVVHIRGRCAIKESWAKVVFPVISLEAKFDHRNKLQILPRHAIQDLLFGLLDGVLVHLRD